MPELPRGWRMRNSSGEVRGPSAEDDAFLSGDESGSDIASGIDIKPDSEGWDDVEEDAETLSIACLLCDATHPTSTAMIEHCKATHDFDFVQIQKQHKLDFYSTIKLINYIRSQHQAGTGKPAVHDPSLWADDKYLQPVLEGDALLFTLDDIVDAPIAAEDQSSEAK